jgi:hypothetical protein
MTRAIAQTPSDLVLSSTTESQEAIEHAVSENWKENFVPAAEKKAADEKAIADAKAILEAQETPEQKEERETAEAEEAAGHEGETDEQKTAREKEEQERIPGKRGWSKRVNKLTARNARIQLELEQERTARQDLERRLAALELGEKAEPRIVRGSRFDNEGVSDAVPDLPNKPKRIDFTDESQYVEKLIQWTKANEEYKDGIQEENERAKQVFVAHGERIEGARDRYEDWDAVAKSAEHMTLVPAVDFAIREMPNSADVLYHIAKNPKVYQAMSRLSPFQQVAEAVRISDRLAGGSRSSTNGNGVVKKTRPSIEPIVPGGRRSTAQGKKLDDMNMDEYYCGPQSATRRSPRKLIL